MIIGIVGDIGSGKTFISKKLSYPVFNADKEIIKIYKKNYQCFKKLKKKFPQHITIFPINKKELSILILTKKNSIKIIGKIIHPYVRKNLNIFLKKYRKEKKLVLDIPLLLENKISIKDLVLIFVDIDKKLVLKRLKKRPNFDKNLYNIIRKNQLPLYLKKKKCKFVIKNTYNKKIIDERIKELKRKINNHD